MKFQFIFSFILMFAMSAPMAQANCNSNAVNLDCRPAHGGSSVVEERAGGIFGILNGRMRYEAFQTPYGRSMRLARRGGIRGIVLGGVNKSFSQSAQGSTASVERFGGERGILFGRTFKQISNYF